MSEGSKSFSDFFFFFLWNLSCWICIPSFLLLPVGYFWSPVRRCAAEMWSTYSMYGYTRRDHYAVLRKRRVSGQNRQQAAWEQGAADVLSADAPDDGRWWRMKTLQLCLCQRCGPYEGLIPHVELPFRLLRTVLCQNEFCHLFLLYSQSQ